MEINHTCRFHHHCEIDNINTLTLHKKFLAPTLFPFLPTNNIINTGPNKDALLVYRALASIKVDPRKIQLFHIDSGNEFKNKLMDNALKTFNIQRSLSMKGCPYDNAVAEATFKIIKTEFVKGQHFDSLEEITSELQDYVH